MKCPKCHRFYPVEYQFCPFDGLGLAERIDPATFKSDPTRIRDKRLGGRYRIRGFVGKGAMARVYLAEDERTGEPVAIKVLEAPFRDDASVRERFHREARAASVIGHKSIVNVFAEGEREDDGAPFLVMEFLVGETVGGYLRREGPMSVELATSSMSQAASALGAAHRAGIIHRDVKPDNLFLLGEPGDPYELKVVDFGLSRDVTSQLTAAGVVVGTPSTMAPEQILGEGVDARTDIYALGMVLYATLTGTDPFAPASATAASSHPDDSGDEVATLAHHLWTTPRPPSDHRGDLDPRLERIVLRAIRKSPDERFASMEEMEQALAEWHRPGRTLPDPLPPDGPFEPRTTIGSLVKASLGRAIGRAVGANP